jgi:hypothetical protein
MEMIKKWFDHKISWFIAGALAGHYVLPFVL